MRCMIIDGNSIVNRAFYGVRPLSTREGLPTHAVYGFLTILQKLLGEGEPDALCVAFDTHAPTFRHAAYEGYKAQRKGMPEDLALQMPILKDVLDAMNIPRYELEGWEADDLIGTVARLNTAAGWETLVVTGDKDALQLVSEQTTVKLVSTRMGQTTTRDMTPAAFQEEYGFTSEKMVDFKALMGDPSDNIPGVPGVGEKTALDLVRRYGTVAALYADLDALDVMPGVRKRLAGGREMARMSHDLAAIRTDAPLAFAPEDAVRRPVNAPVLYELFLKLEFSKLIDQLELSAQGDPAAGAPEGARGTCSSELLTDRGRMEELLARWESVDAVSVLALPSLDAVAVEWREDGRGSCAALALADRLDCHNDFLRGLFGNGEIKKASHNIKDLMNALLGEGIEPAGFVFDTAVAAYLLAPTDGSYDLEKLGMTYYNQVFPKTADYTAPGAFGPLADLSAPTGAILSHCALIGALRDTLTERLEALGMHRLYHQVELPLCLVLARMERAGFLVDRKALSDFGAMLCTRIDGVKDTIYGLAGDVFNINSTQQLGCVLFDKLGLPPVKKTKTGYSTNAEVLEKLRGLHPIVEAILEYRQLTKLNSTYVEGLSKVIPPDGRVHTSFQNTVTATGRLSSAEPNLQNIPVRTELGAELRKMFVAPPGRVLVDADYSQIELRLLAHISGDTAMIEAFRSGQDIHTVTASQVFGVAPADVTHEMRRRAKAVNFGIVYGISAFSLSQDIGVFPNEAKEYMDRYFETYHGVRSYMEDIVKQAKKDGYVSTLLGRRRWLPELNASNYNVRSFGERVALNMPIQGTAADVIKLAMLRVDQALRQEVPDARLILQIHDELVVECREEDAERVKELLRREMESAMPLSPPLAAEAGAGKSWAEAT
ncbi:MAG: DNA polymerase I [Clostridiales bacterium]|nr:DNA polymerase I [Clostridiales bacterium]